MTRFFHDPLTILFLLGLAAIILTRVGTTVMTYLSKKRGPRPSRLDSLIEDRPAFDSAAADVATQGREMAVLATFDTAHGYMESDIVKMTAFLGNHSIPASYSKTFVYGVEVFTVLVPAELLESAKAVWAQRNSDEEHQPR